MIDGRAMNGTYARVGSSPSIGVARASSLLRSVNGKRRGEFSDQQQNHISIGVAGAFRSQLLDVCKSWEVTWENMVTKSIRERRGKDETKVPHSGVSY